RYLSAQFEHNKAQKEYLALVVGRPASTSGQIDAPLAPHPRRAGCMTIAADGKPARTEWRIEEPFLHLTLLRIRPRTGRTHQMRVGDMSVGTPLAVDALYNAPPSSHEPGVFLSSFKRSYRESGNGAERPLIARLTLHAQRLTFTDKSGQSVTVEGPLPKDFR